MKFFTADEIHGIIKENLRKSSRDGYVLLRHLGDVSFLEREEEGWWCKSGKGYRVIITSFISKKSVNKVLDRFNTLRIYKWRIHYKTIAARLNPIIRGIKNYYCKFWADHTHYLWQQLNGFAQMSSMGERVVQESSPEMASE
jgi:hypothetical protein